MTLLNDLKGHDCKDGRKMYVLKDLSKLGRIFAVYYPTFSCKVNASLSALNSMLETPTVGVELSNNIKPIFENLDKMYLAEYGRFVEKYIEYSQNPCAERPDERRIDKSLMDALTFVEDSLRSLRAMMFQESQKGRPNWATMNAEIDKIDKEVRNRLNKHYGQ